MSNVLSEEKKQQVIALGRLCWSLREIEKATGVRRETASGYLKEAGVVVRAPRKRLAPKPASSPGVITDFGRDISNPASQVITDSGPIRSPSVSACERHREFIERAIQQGRNAVAIWQELVTDHGFSGRYSSVMRFVRKNFRAQSAEEPFGIISTAPGQEAQVDYGEGPMVRHPQTGKYRRTRLFVFTLGYSRKSVRLLTWKSSTKIWAQLHEQAFQRIGGVCAAVVLDNLKEGVLAPDVYDPALNPLFRDVLAHYGSVALPCRVRDPNRKGKVERAVAHAQQTALKGLRFETIEDAQAHLDRWEERWADTRIHGTTKRQVLAMFEEEKPHLKALPAEPFRYYSFGTRRVHTDGCVEIASAYYGAPPRYIGQQVLVQWNERCVRLLDIKTGVLLREHLRQRPGSHALLAEDRFKKTPPAVHTLLGRASRVGSATHTLCESIWQLDGQAGIRRIQGVLRLAKTENFAAVEDACTAALELGVPNYRFVRRFIERRQPLQLTLKQVDPLIRELSHYKALIERTTYGEK